MQLQWFMYNVRPGEALKGFPYTHNSMCVLCVSDDAPQAPYVPKPRPQVQFAVVQLEPQGKPAEKTPPRGQLQSDNV